MRFSSAATLGFAATALAAKETVTVSKLNIHSVGTPIKTTLKSVSFTLNGADAKNLKCSAKNLAYPTPEKSYPCGDSDYSFLIWEGEKEQFGIMIYHDVGDAKADLRGGRDIKTNCDNSQGSGPADEICTQGKPVSFKIDGPVGISPN
ncbi:hypothetical protein NW752_001577 [Fusarium irregulare]|uniref:AA1-like domain-containing protein n=1 Tax=Fusarium irregulare TaxID=2494466 RepID=A0A9W8PU37_9HYPO|nr:hypothetical protein NW766_003738 [Fusarium irregulare]KAJ4026626.1 hypothetical protein NW752_001577 [Fusarium irregulare]